MVLHAICMTHENQRCLKSPTHISLLHQPLSLCCIQAIGLNQKSLLKGIFVNLKKGWEEKTLLYLETMHWVLMTNMRSGTCRSDSMPRRLRRRLRSIVSPFRSSSICSKMPSTVRFWTALSLTMWVRNSSSPVSLQNTQRVSLRHKHDTLPTKKLNKTYYTRWRGVKSSEAHRSDPGRERYFGSLSVK